MSRYTLIQKLGQGGMGAVFRASDTELERDVAIKFLLEVAAADAGLVKRWEREIRACFELAHPGIVKVLDYGQVDGKQYYVMELIDGARPMDRLIEEEHPLRIPRIKRLLDQLLDALDYCHAHKFLHRDIKPANIMVKTDDHLILMDFGLVKPKERTIVTQHGQVIGTPHYLAPELLRGKPASEQSDLFAVGAVLYELLTTQRAFPGDSITDIARAILRDSPGPVSAVRSDVPQGTDALIERFLAKDPAARVATAAEARRLVSQWAPANTPGNTSRIKVPRSTGATHPIPAPPPAMVQPAQGGGPSRKVLAAGGIAVLAGGIILGSIVMRRPAPTESSPSAPSAPAALDNTQAHIDLRWAPTSLTAAWNSRTPCALTLDAVPTLSSSDAGAVTTMEASSAVAHLLTLGGLRPSTEYRVRATVDGRQVLDTVGRTGSLTELGLRMLRTLDALGAWTLLGSLRSDYRTLIEKRVSEQKALGPSVAARWTRDIAHRIEVSGILSLASQFSSVKDDYFRSLDVPLEDKIALAGDISELCELELATRYRKIAMPALATRMTSRWYGSSDTPVFDYTHELAIEWVKGWRSDHGPPVKGRVVSAQDPLQDLFVLYAESREGRFLPGYRNAGAAGLDTLSPHWSSEPPIELSLPPVASVRQAQLFLLLEDQRPENPFRLFLRAPGADRWRYVADVRSSGEGVRPVYLGLDPRLLIPGSRLRVELIFLEEFPGDQKGRLKSLSFEWSLAQDAVAPPPSVAPSRR